MGSGVRQLLKVLRYAGSSKPELETLGTMLLTTQRSLREENKWEAEGIRRPTGESHGKGPVLCSYRDTFFSVGPEHIGTTIIYIYAILYTYCLSTLKESLYFFKKNCILWYTVMFKVGLDANPLWLAQFISVAIGILMWRVGSHLNPPSQYLECRFERLTGRKKRAVQVMMRRCVHFYH